jgi:predicted GTPase
MEQWMLTSVPGSRLLTIKQWRSLQSAPKWIRRFQYATWAASILMNPMNIAGFLVSKLTVDPVTNALQMEFLSALYLRFFQFVGFYLIEMNSGRLRGGADAYRRAFPTWAAGWAGGSPGQSAGESVSASVAAQPLTIALVGQVSSGKSSLINALTGSHQAAVDILPETRAVERYHMALGEPSVAVTLLDTPGYGEIGATADQMQQIQAALKESNAVLLVMDAHSPAREADRRTIRDLEAWYLTQPRLKPPPMLGVLTHVDLLRPTLEWSPPYDWREPSRPKEQSIHDAVGYARELFAGSLAGVAPVCTDARPERAWGILEEVLPALTLIVSDAQSAALLRAFEHELDQARLKTLLRQVQRCGSELLRCWIEERLRPEAGEGEA